MSSRRRWFVAIGDMSGEHEGNPLALDASDVYGPFTPEQALKLSKMGDGFPHASYGVQIFRACPGRFREVARLIKAKKAEAILEAEESSEEQVRIRASL